MEAPYSEMTQLSYHTLVGTQSNLYQMLSSSSAQEFLSSKGYLEEAKYVCVIRNWRRACDEIGLTDDQRSVFNQWLISYILDELMPWHCQSRYFSLLEVNQ